MQSLKHLISEARSLANDGPCAAGHRWESVGGRTCPELENNPYCSQTVYVCAVCGEYDYGDKGGPAWIECEHYCRFKNYIECVKLDFAEQE